MCHEYSLIGMKKNFFFLSARKKSKHTHKKNPNNTQHQRPWKLKGNYQKFMKVEK